jgi:hypothetical protein
MGSVGSLRSALFFQAALTAGWGLLRSSGGPWTILTMVVAAGAVFVGAALQPTSDWRTWLLAFEGLAVTYGVLSLPAHHVVPATALAVTVLGLALTGGAKLSFAGRPVGTLGGGPDLSATLVQETAFFAQAPVVEVPQIPVQEIPVQAPAVTSAPASMTILPQG